MKRKKRSIRDGRRITRGASEDVELVLAMNGGNHSNLSTYIFHIIQIPGDGELYAHIDLEEALIGLTFSRCLTKTTELRGYSGR